MLDCRIQKMKIEAEHNRIYSAMPIEKEDD